MVFHGRLCVHLRPFETTREATHFGVGSFPTEAAWVDVADQEAPLLPKAQTGRQVPTPEAPNNRVASTTQMIDPPSWWFEFVVLGIRTPGS